MKCFQIFEKVEKFVLSFQNNSKNSFVSITSEHGKFLTKKIAFIKRTISFIENPVLCLETKIFRPASMYNHVKSLAGNGIGIHHFWFSKGGDALHNCSIQTTNKSALQNNKFAYHQQFQIKENNKHNRIPKNSVSRPHENMLERTINHIHRETYSFQKKLLRHCGRIQAGSFRELRV